VPEGHRLAGGSTGGSSSGINGAMSSSASLATTAVSSTAASSSVTGETERLVLFPQWEWVLCVVAFQAVETAINESSTYTNPARIPSMLADVITSIAAALQSRSSNA